MSLPLAAHLPSWTRGAPACVRPGEGLPAEIWGEFGLPAESGGTRPCQGALARPGALSLAGTPLAPDTLGLKGKEAGKGLGACVLFFFSFVFAPFAFFFFYK